MWMEKECVRVRGKNRNLHRITHRALNNNDNNGRNCWFNADIIYHTCKHIARIGRLYEKSCSLTSFRQLSPLAVALPPACHTRTHNFLSARQTDYNVCLMNECIAVIINSIPLKRQNCGSSSCRDYSAWHTADVHHHAAIQIRPPPHPFLPLPYPSSNLSHSVNAMEWLMGMTSNFQTVTQCNMQSVNYNNINAWLRPGTHPHRMWR